MFFNVRPNKQPPDFTVVRGLELYALILKYLTCMLGLHKI